MGFFFGRFLVICKCLILTNLIQRRLNLTAHLLYFRNYICYPLFHNNMKNLFTILLLATVLSASAQEQAQIVKLSELQNIINSRSEHIKVINFWATWCAPCVKEMPLFEKLDLERDDVKVTFVSMDLDLDPDPSKVYKFVARKKLQSEVVILDEANPDSWINAIEKSWSGAIPATIVINGKTGQRKFVEKELHEGDLEKLITEVQ